MSILNRISIAALTLSITFSNQSHGQDEGHLKAITLDSEAAQAPKVVVVTGARFSYDLVQRWIDDYNKVNPEVQIIVEHRGSNDPLQFDILAEVYDQPADVQNTREYISVGRYAVLPVATASSAFAKYYREEGLNRETIKQVFFHDIFADKEKQKPVKAPFTVYTRTQKAGVPIAFARYFGFEQKDIKGKGIAGADSHLLKALLRDSTGVTYLPTPLIFNKQTRKPIDGLAVLPVDLNGNGKVNDAEKFFSNLDEVVKQLESADPEDIKNIPIEYLHLSVDKEHASVEAIQFLKWVHENGQASLHEFGYLNPESARVAQDNFNEFALKRGF